MGRSAPKPKSRGSSRRGTSSGARSKYFHVIGQRPGGETKYAYNKTEEEVLEDYVIPFVDRGTMRLKYGGIKEIQVVDMRVYSTPKTWDKKSDGPLEEFVKGQRNLIRSFRKRAEKTLSQSGPRVFVVMPIQGKSSGSQSEKRVFQEYNQRFRTIESLLASGYGATAIRIDKEYPLVEMVGQIKKEIEGAAFVIADLTDERPSCYFEAGYATAKGRLVLYIASEESVLSPGEQTKIHFDIHNHVSFFTDHGELELELKNKIEKHKERLFPSEISPTV